MDQLQKTLQNNMVPTTQCPLDIAQGFNYTLQQVLMALPSPSIHPDSQENFMISQMFTVPNPSSLHDHPLSTLPQRKKRPRFSQEQLDVMEEVFSSQSHNPKIELRKRLAEQLGLEESRVSIWFNNRRAKYRKEMLLMGMPVQKTPPPIKSQPSTKTKLPQRVFLLPCVPNNTPVSSPIKSPFTVL